MASRDALLHQALGHHQAGEFARAERIYLDILRQEPRLADALYLLGTLYLQKNSLDQAEPLLRRAIAARPDHAEARNNLGLTLAERGDADAAIDEFRRAAAARTQYPDPLYNLGNALRSKGRPREAADAYRRAIAIDPLRPRYLENLAIALREANQLDEALATIDRAAAIEPASAIALNTRGAILKAMGRFAEAADAFGRACELDPDMAEAWSNRGVTLAQLLFFDEAESCCRRAIARSPQSATAHHNLGLVHHALGRNQEAAESFLQAVTLKRDFTDAFANLGACFHDAGDYAQAERAYRMALDLDADHYVALSNLGAALESQGQAVEAKECFHRSYAIQPTSSLTRLRAQLVCPLVFEDAGQIASFRRQLDADLDEAIERGERHNLASLLANDARPPFNLQFHGLNERLTRERFARLIGPSMEYDPPPPGVGPPRMGFLVTHGHEWAFQRSIGGLFAHFRRDWTPMVICAGGAIEGLRAALANSRVEFIPLAPGIERTIQSLREAKLDLLYHWEIATAALNYLLPFCRVAQAQVTSWGIQVTSGIPAIDAYLSSEWVEVTDADEHYTERLVRLKTMMSYQRRLAPPRVLRPKSSFGLPEDAHLYLCAQHLGKFHPDYDPILRGILEKDEHAHIVVTEGRTAGAVLALRERWRRTIGPVADRIVMLPNQSGDDYFSLVHQADVVLDPLHFGGVNTTYDALSYNQALVTLPSPFHRGRYTAGCLRSIGVTDTIASSPDDYIAIAVRLATDMDYRDDVRRRIDAQSGSLFENPQVAYELEDWLLSEVERRREQT